MFTITAIYDCIIITYNATKNIFNKKENFNRLDILSETQNVHLYSWLVVSGTSLAVQSLCYIDIVLL